MPSKPALTVVETPETPTFIRPEDRAKILDALASINQSCAILNKAAKKKKAVA